MYTKPKMLEDVTRTTLVGFEPPVDTVRIEDYTTEELYQHVLSESDPVTLELLLMEVRIRGLVPLDWLNDEVVEFIRTDETPPQTIDGLWVQSLTRNTRRQLTYAEIRAYLRGEIPLPKMVHVAHIPVQLREMLEGVLGTSVRHWSVIELTNFVTTDTRPLKTLRGVYRNSPLRAVKEVQQWLDAELLDWVEGYIGLGEVVTEPQAIAELQKRYNIPTDWSRQEIATWVSHAIIPEYTVDGVWVNSTVRVNKTMDEWTTVEIVAYARGEITVADERRKDLMREIRSRYFYPATINDDRMLSDIRAKGVHIEDNSKVALTESTRRFVEGIQSAATDRDAGFVHTKFLQELRAAMVVRPEEFLGLWTGVLDTAAANEAVVFNDVSVFRGFDTMTATQVNRDSYSQLLLLIINTMHPETRYSLERPLSFIAPIRFTGARDNLSLYYRI